MNRVSIHPVIFHRLKSISEATGQPMTKMVEEALARLVGLEGIPLRDEEVYGQPEKEKDTP